MTYKHYLITRFNIRTYYTCSLKNPNNNPMDLILDVDYLTKRFHIFENYTLPSIEKQTSQNFTWIILFHKRTPEIFKLRIKELKRKYQFIDLYLDDDEKFDFEYYVDHSNQKCNWYITSRIDNDDMLNTRYIESVQKLVDDNIFQRIISFKNGLKINLQNQKKYFYEAKNNHFLSMIAPKNINILMFNHAKIFSSGEKIELIDNQIPMWIELVHDSNVINRIKSEDLKNESIEIDY